MTTQTVTPVQAPTTSYTYVQTLSQLEFALNRFTALTTKKKVAVDTETTGLSPFTDQLLLLQLYSEEGGSLVIDCRSIFLADISRLVRPILESSDWLKIAHNWMFDLGMIKAHLDIEVVRLYDTMIAEKLLTIGTGAACDLEAVAKRYLDVYLDKEVRKDFIGMPIDQVFTPAMLRYASEDVEVLPPIVARQSVMLQRYGLVEVAKVEFECLPVLVAAHLRGVLVEVERWREYIAQVAVEAEEQSVRLREALQPFVDQYRRQKEAGKSDQYELDLMTWEEARSMRETLANQALERALAEGKSKGEARKIYNAVKKTIPCPSKPQPPDAGSGPINLKSSEQLGHALILAGIPLPIKDGKPQTRAYFLEELAEDYELVAWVLALREDIKLVDSFGENVLSFVDANGRMHPEFSPLGAVTGRHSCRRPNMQQVPNSARGKLLRECIIAPPGYKLVAADYAQAELRILAELSGEEAAIWAINSGVDLHSLTALRMFPEASGGLKALLDDMDADHDDYALAQVGLALLAMDVETLLVQVREREDLLTPFAWLLGLIKKHMPDLRHMAKTLNFGLAYGLSPRGMSIQVHIPLEEAKKHVAAYFSSNPAIDAWLKRAREQGVAQGWAVTPFGRRRWFLRNPHDPKRERKEYFARQGRMERQAGNFPIQGHNADWTKCAIAAMSRIFRERGLDAHPILFVHDEIVVEVRDDQVAEVQAIVSESMVRAGQQFMKRVKVEVDAQVGDHWIH